MIRRKKLTIFTDAKDTTSVLELKKIIEGILKVPPVNQQLYNKDNVLMDDDKALQDYGLNSSVAKAQNPASVGLAIKLDNGEFEPLEITPYSSPPDLPYVMKAQENNGQEPSSWKVSFTKLLFYFVLVNILYDFQQFIYVISFRLQQFLLFFKKLNWYVIT